MTDKGSIYISNFAAASDLPLLQSKILYIIGKNIKAVLSVARSGLLHHRKEDIPHYLYIPAEDHEDYELSKYFSQTYEFIENARKETNVLVHCMVGVSRSVTIVIAYLLKKYKYTLSQVISLIQRKRRKVQFDLLRLILTKDLSNN
jgi:protein-tyrosine phosphatase